MTTLDVTVCPCGVVMPLGYSGTLCVACTRRAHDLPRPSERLSPPDGPTAGAPVYECPRSAGGCGMQSDDWDEYVAHRRDKHLSSGPVAA